MVEVVSAQRETSAKDVGYLSAESSDVDAEGEDDDIEMAEQNSIGGTEDGEEETEGEEGESDGEGEGIDEDDGSDKADDDQGFRDKDPNDATNHAADGDSGEEFVGAVKIRSMRRKSESDNEDDFEDASEGHEPVEADAASSSSSEKDSSDESAVGEQWDGSSDGQAEAELEVATRNNCIFCERAEEDDPSEDFEEYLACAVCGDNAHPHCARGSNSLKPDEDTKGWRCPDCISNALEPDKSEEAVRRRRSSTSKLTRDLLPVPSLSKPGSHSVFNTLILDDDPLDGSRALRKRKTSSEDADEHSRTSSKRTKRQASTATDVSVPRSTSDQRQLLPKYDDQERASKESHSEIQVLSSEPTKLKSTRPVRRKEKKEAVPVSGLVRVVRRNSRRLILAFPLSLLGFPSLTTIAEKRKKRQRLPPTSSPEMVSRHRHPIIHHPSSQFATSFYAFHERENDELKSKPYGGILSDADADTSKTLPQAADRAQFEEARQKAEEEWKQKTAASEAEQEIKGRASQKVSGPPSKIKCINFGGYEIETWYAAPYPEEYSRNRILYICEFCLKYMNSDYVAWRHKLKCPAKHPPGDEIYRDGSVSVFEVDGRKNPVYCQNLCLLAKLFLGSKTLYYDVEPFLFYIMTEYDELGCHFVGYFSKEKRPSSLNNVSCILTLPTHQRKGYGNLLIDFSYLLTRVEQKTGSPEKPLSDMGLVSYRNYWRLVLSYLLLDRKEPIGINDISEETGMTADDIVAALEALRALVRDPVTKTYALRLDHDYFRQCIETWEVKKYVKLNPDSLVWTPYIMGRSNLAHYDRAPPLVTVAPREGEEDEVPLPGHSVTLVGPNHEHGADHDERTQMSQAPAISDPNQQLVHEGTDNGAMSVVPGPPPPSETQILLPTVSPSRDVPSTPNGPPNRHNVKTPNDSADQVPPIPPTRYEVYPPVPGTISRRRGGWRGGQRRSMAASGASSARRSGTGRTRFMINEGGRRAGKPFDLAGAGKSQGKGILHGGDSAANGVVNNNETEQREGRIIGLGDEMDEDSGEGGDHGAFEKGNAYDDADDEDLDAEGEIDFEAEVNQDAHDAEMRGVISKVGTDMGNGRMGSPLHRLPNPFGAHKSEGVVAS
ncbi:hypothetical protein MMC25_005849 [Agyrium rufum]|nr:hypothetical protein [Agyrium rufum]